MTTQLSPAIYDFFAVSITAVGTIGIVANFIVIVAVLSNAKLRRAAMNALLVNMAIADLLFIVVLGAGWLPMFYKHDWWWHLPPTWCTWHNYASAGLVFTSILTYITIAVERYLVIVHPMKFTTALNSTNRSSAGRRNLLIIIGLWLFAAVYELPELLTTRRIMEYPYGNTTLYVCTATPNTTPIVIFKWSEAAMTYVIPITISAVLYTKICRVLWTSNVSLYKREHIEMSARADPTSTATNGATSVSPQQRKLATVSKQEEVLAARRAVVKMMIVCVTVFFACYTPAVIGFIGASIIPNALALPLWFTPLVILLEILCSSINPFIYTLFSAKIRRRIWTMLRKMPCMSKSFSGADIADSTTSGLSGQTVHTKVSMAVPE